jgi:hypothetical protein
MARLLQDAAAGRFEVILVADPTRILRGEGPDWEKVREACRQGGAALATPAGIFWRPGEGN